MMTSFLQMIFDLPTPFNMVVVIVLIGTGAGVITSIAKQTRKYAIYRHELAFKRELIERGMSADEIAEIIEAAPASKSSGNRTTTAWKQDG